MQNQETSKQNVVSLFSAREKAAAKADASVEATEEGKPGESFSDIMERNAKNAERIAKERANANKGVLRSYRIKN